MLVDNTWKSSMSQNFYGTDIEVHFNPNVPNGWYDGTNCDTGWRYDLRTVMRHELLHGAGLSSSIRHSASQTSVGYTSLGQCYPTFYDTRLESEGVPLVDGCTYNRAGRHRLHGRAKGVCSRRLSFGFVLLSSRRRGVVPMAVGAARMP